MKLPVSICALLVAVSSQVTAEQPYEIRHLLEQREAAIKKVNATAAKELEQLKKGYMKKGDLEAANKAAKTQKSVSFGKVGSLATKSTFYKEVVGKKWQWHHKHQKHCWFILHKDGTATFNGKKDVLWKLFENRTIVFYIGHTKRSGVLSWCENYQSYEGVDVNFQTKIYGKEIR